MSRIAVVVLLSGPYRSLGALFLAGLISVLVPATAQAAAPQAVAMERRADCFRFESYDDWVAFVQGLQAESRRPFDLDRFQARYPRQRYDAARAAMHCEFFSYRVAGVEVGGFSAAPKAAIKDGEKLPVLIYNRGGSGTRGTINFAAMLDVIFPLAAEGFLVVGSQYREADEFGGADVDDVLALFDLIDAMPSADPERIGMLGWSRGGMQSFLAAKRTTRLLALAVGAAPTDLLADLEVRPEMENVYRVRIPNYEKNKIAALRARSVVHWVEELPEDLPILILQGQADKRVRLEHALNLARRLNEVGRAFRLVVYPQGDHGLRRYRAEVEDEFSTWFRQALGAAPLPGRPLPGRSAE